MARSSIPRGGQAALREGLGHVARAASERDFVRLASLLDADSGAVSRAAALALRESLPDSAPALVSRLGTAAPGSLLAERCLQASVPGLAAILLDELDTRRDPRSRAALFGALSRACDESSFDRLLCLAIETGDYFAAAAAVSSIERLGPVLPVEALARALNESAQEALSAAAAGALAARGGPEDVGALAGALGGRRKRVSALALKTLFGMGGEGRATAARAGGDAGGRPPGDLPAAASLAREGAHEDAVRLLQPALKSGDAAQALPAVWLLSLCGAPGVEPLVFAIRSDEALRVPASLALFENRSEESLDALGFLVRDEYAPARFAAAFALGLGGHEIALEPLKEALREGDTAWKVLAARALAGIRDESAREALLEASRDLGGPAGREASISLALSWPGSGGLVAAAGSVATQASSWHLSFLRDAEGIVDNLVAMLSSPAPRDRLFAVRELGCIGSASAADALAGAILDDDEKVALESRIALSRLSV